MTALDHSHFGARELQISASGNSVKVQANVLIGHQPRVMLRTTLRERHAALQIDKCDHAVRRKDARIETGKYAGRSGYLATEHAIAAPKLLNHGFHSDEGRSPLFDEARIVAFDLPPAFATADQYRRKDRRDRSNRLHPGSSRAPIDLIAKCAFGKDLKPEHGADAVTIPGASA